MSYWPDFIVDQIWKFYDSISLCWTFGHFSVVVLLTSVRLVNFINACKRSCGEVMFLHLSVNLSTGDVYPSMQLGRAGIVKTGSGVMVKGGGVWWKGMWDRDCGKARVAKEGDVWQRGCTSPPPPQTQPVTAIKVGGTQYILVAIIIPRMMLKTFKATFHSSSQLIIFVKTEALAPMNRKLP